MFKSNEAFSSFSVDNIETAKEFYGNKLGLDFEEYKDMGTIHLKFGNGAKTMVYSKDNHQPATYTCLNFFVQNIESAVDELISKGITMEQYDMPELKTDPKGISRWEGGGPAMAWFKDPAGNILAVMEDKK